VDPGDADLATFFHYFAQAAQAAAGRKKLRLPALTPEFMADLPGFTRRFMRELWAKVPVPATVVLDNYQDLPAEAMLHTVLPIALAEFPIGATLIVISREDAPTDWGQGVIQPQIGHIRWNDLQLTLEETRALAAAVPGLDEAVLETIRAQTKGWVAGTVLMLEGLKCSESYTALNSSETHTGFFAYFAQQVFARLEERTKTVLLRTALLPWMTGNMAKEVSGHSGAEQVLRELYQRGLFVDRRVDAQVTYHCHDLFREFLVDYCVRRYGEDELHDLKRTAAAVAERAGQHDTAVALYADTKSWDDLSRLICEVSELLLAQGRNQTVQGYIGLLAEPEREKRPWVLYWSGVSRVLFDPGTARKDLERAFIQFEVGRADTAGLVLCCGSIIEAYYCSADDLAPTIVWGDRLRKILQEHRGFPSPAIEARVLAGLQGLIFACPHHPLILELDESLEQILNSLDDPAARVGVASTFMNLMTWRGEFPRLRQALEALTLRCNGLDLPPMHLLTWKIMEAHYEWSTGRHASAPAKFDQAFGIVERYGMLVFRTMVRGCQAFSTLANGDDREAERFADLMQAENLLHQRFTQGLCSYYRAGASLIKGDLSSALNFASSAVETMDSLRFPWFVGTFREGLAKVLIELGEMARAREHLEEVIIYARTMRSTWSEAQCLLTLAYSYLRDWRLDLAREPLRKGLGIASRYDYLVLDFWWRPKVMAELLAHALEADIEVEYVRSVIRRRNLRAPSPAVKHWPYPVKISTLGRFEIVIDDDLLTTAGKTQRKPLELLKYLCATGTQGINQEDIEEALWPEADGEAADQAFRTTLHRLRKLLRHDDAVQLSDRHVSFDPSLVSVDHLAFDCMTQNIDRSDAAAIERTLALYRGHFLQGETAAWALSVRERLRARFLDLTERLGALLEERGEVGEATQTYLRALEVEPVAEVMCRRVMMTYVRLGRRSEAIGVYQRFSQALRTKLSVPPAPETVSLYHDIAKP
jgi:DNA-binding SARP family transcriptional activator